MAFRNQIKKIIRAIILFFNLYVHKLLYVKDNVVITVKVHVECSKFAPADITKH
jgi:hypothetical protein